MSPPATIDARPSSSLPSRSLQPSSSGCDQRVPDPRLLRLWPNTREIRQRWCGSKPTDGQLSIGVSDPCSNSVRRLRASGKTVHEWSDRVACYATSDKARINAEASSGVTGDPYAPIKPGGDASITPKRETFGYRGIAKLFNAKLPILATVQEVDATDGLSLSFSALVRRGGTDTNTEGLFQRPIPTSRMEEIVQYGPTKALSLIAAAATARATRLVLLSG